jgi:hypothetical protein
MNMLCIGCPADTADRPGELKLAVAGSTSLGRAAARAVNRDDGWPVLHGKVNDLHARQVALERQNPALIDDGDVEALSLSAHINADPRSHVTKHAPTPVPPAL